MNRTSTRSPGPSRHAEQRERSLRRVRLACVLAIGVLWLIRPALAAAPPGAASELREVLEELESFSEQMEALAAGDRRLERAGALRILSRFEQRLPELRRRSRGALLRLEGRIEREAGRVRRKQRLAAAAARKLEELRRSVEAPADRRRPCSPREERVRALTRHLVAALILEKEQQAARSAAALEERSQRRRALDRELAESSARLESLFARLEGALPRAAALLGTAPVLAAPPQLLDRGPRQLALALGRIQTALLQIMKAQVATLEALNTGPVRGGDKNSSRPRDRQNLATESLPDASSLRVRPAAEESPERPDS